MHGSDMKVECNICGCEFIILNDLANMMISSIIPNRVYECETCKKKRSYERTRLRLIRLNKTRQSGRINK